jgi:hypothetical protein
MKYKNKNKISEVINYSQIKKKKNATEHEKNIVEHHINTTRISLNIA